MSAPLPSEAMLETVRDWATARPDLRLVVVIGSLARLDRPADPMSDVDLLLFSADPRPYIAHTAWLDELAPHRLTFVEGTAVGGALERRVLFDDDLDADFIPLPVQIVEGDPAPELGAVLRRGYRVLVDKAHYALKLEALLRATPGEGSGGAPPSAQAFSDLVNDFLYHAVWTAKKLRRGELWTAKMCSDGLMKRQLLQLIEWHAKAFGAIDTWHEGRFLDAWGERSVMEALRGTFATYDAASVAAALGATLRLFGRLGQEIGDGLGYGYPSSAHEHVVQLLKRYRIQAPEGRPPQGS